MGKLGIKFLLEFLGWVWWENGDAMPFTLEIVFSNAICYWHNFETRKVNERIRNDTVTYGGM